jgi:hypothetical protein
LGVYDKKIVQNFVRFVHPSPGAGGLYHRLEILREKGTVLGAVRHLFGTAKLIIRTEFGQKPSHLSGRNHFGQNQHKLVLKKHLIPKLSIKLQLVAPPTLLVSSK